MDSRFLDMCKSVLDAAGEGVLGDGLSVLCGVDGCLRSLHDAGLLKSRDLDDPAAELAGKLRGIDDIAVFPDNVHHVYRDNDRDAELRELGGKVKVSLKVGSVDDIEYRVGALADKIVTGDNLLKGVGRKRVDAGKVGD